MVRLKETGQIKVDQLIKFQFQYGAIKSLPSIVEVPNTVEFQFQYGAIKSYLNVVKQKHF